MKKIWIVIGAVLLLGAAAAGGFWGGMTYQSNLLEQARSNFELRRGPLSGEMPGEGMNMPPGEVPQGRLQGGFMGGTIGIIKSVDGNVITISTAQDVTTVNLSAGTLIQKSVSVGMAELQPGMRVLVAGERDDENIITATQVTIVNEDARLPGQPVPTGKAP